MFMKPEDFEVVHLLSGATHYHHIENGKKREEIIKLRMSGKMTQEEFVKLQKKMRGGYLKMIYSEKDYLKIINTPLSTEDKAE